MIRRSIRKFWCIGSSQPVANLVRESPVWACAERRDLSVSSSKNSKSASGKNADDEDLDKPIQFTTSKASKTTAQETLGGDPFPNAPWYQPLVVSFSVGIFLLYFLALREENDLDEYIGQPLWQKVPGLEKQQLEVVLDYNLKHNLDVTDIVRRLKEIENEQATSPRQK